MHALILLRRLINQKKEIISLRPARVVCSILSTINRNMQKNSTYGMSMHEILGEVCVRVGKSINLLPCTTKHEQAAFQG